MFKLLPAILLFSVAVGTVSAVTDKVVCYWGTWSVYRWGNGLFTVDDIDPTLCTHVIYTFVGIQGHDGNVRLLDSYLDIDRKNLQRFNELKSVNANLKTLIAIGGWNEGSENYSKVCADPAKRANFIASALALVQTWGFDGFDLDWEYPNQRGGAAEDIANYVTLIKEFREAFAPHGLLLTAAVAAAAPSVDLSYDVPGLNRYLDFINVMTYDLHGSWENVTGHNAPLYASAVDVTDNQKLLNVDAAIRGWIARGADPQKLVLGLGVYGRSFSLASASNNQLGAPVTGGGNAGKYTRESGMIGYNEIVELQNEGGWTEVWDDVQKVPHMYKGNQWIGYDNPMSITLKVEYAKSLNLGGAMIWSFETDDFKGLSGTKYPILKTINAALKGNIPPPDPQPTVAPTAAPSVPDVTEQPTEEPSAEPTVEPTAQPTAEPTAQPTAEPTAQPTAEPTADPGTDGSNTTSGDEKVGLCEREGYIRDPDNCAVFYYCLPHKGEFVALRQHCNEGLLYDEQLNACNYPEQVQC